MFNGEKMSPRCKFMFTNGRKYDIINMLGDRDAPIQRTGRRKPTCFLAQLTQKTILSIMKNEKNIRREFMIYYLFDFDGTLCNTNEGVVKSVLYALDKMGVENTLGEDELKTRFIGPPLTQSFPYYFADDADSVALAIKHFRDRYNSIGVRENSLFDGIRQMLEVLTQRGRKMYICSSKPKRFIMQILAEHDIGKYFENVYSPNLDEDNLTKYDVIMLAKNEIERMDASPQIYMIGDRKYDVQGAHKASLACIGVRWGCAEPDEFEACGTDVIVDSIEQLLEFDKMAAESREDNE